MKNKSVLKPLRDWKLSKNKSIRGYQNFAGLYKRKRRGTGSTSRSVENQMIRIKSQTVE